MRKSPREIEMRVALIDDDHAFILYDAEPPSNAQPGSDAAPTSESSAEPLTDAPSHPERPPLTRGDSGGSIPVPPSDAVEPVAAANEPQAPARGSSDVSATPSRAFIAYWYDYQTGELFVFGRRLYDRNDAGHALRNLARDLAADPGPLLELDPELERALAMARREPEELARWRPMDDGVLETLLGSAEADATVADAPEGEGVDPDLDPAAAGCGETSGTGPRRIVPRGPTARTDSHGLLRAALQIVGCGGGCAWCDRGGWITVEEMCPPCTKCCPYPGGCCDPGLCDPETGWCIQTCCRSDKFCIPLTSSCCDYTACSSNQHCCHAPDPDRTRCCPTGYACCGTNPVYCCAPGDVCCNGQCGPPGCCDLTAGGCEVTTIGCCQAHGGNFRGYDAVCCPDHPACCPATTPICCGTTGCCGGNTPVCCPSDGHCCPTEQECCGTTCIDPETQGCCGGQPYNLLTQKCCDEGGTLAASVTAGGGNPEVCAIDASCCVNACCADGHTCCNQTQCCDPNRCCDGLVCCPSLPCRACVDYGSLSHGALAVSPPLVCIGEIITFSLTDADDTGGSRIVPCSVVEPIAPAPHCTWTLTIPPNYPPPLPPQNGDGCTAAVEAKVAGTYSCSFTLSADRPCDPAPLEVGPAQARAVKLELRKLTNAQSVRGAVLDDQVITGASASFQAELDVEPPGESYHLEWTVGGVTSSWQGGYTTSPSGSYAYQIPQDLQHTLSEALVARARVGANGPICDTMNRNLRVLFDVDGHQDIHHRAGGDTRANWFLHWGIDADGACSTFAATASMLYFGAGVVFDYGGPGGNQLRAEYNGLFTSPRIKLYDLTHSRENESFASPAMTYTDSAGNNVTAAAGAITIAYDLTGIDAINLDIYHEAEHLHTDLRWEPNGDWRTAYGARMADDGDGILEPGENDFDDDEIPNAVEDAHPGYRWDRSRTHSGFYLGGDDEEILCEQAAIAAPPGNAASDWAFEGKQSTPSN